MCYDQGHIIFLEFGPLFKILAKKVST
jgi:hypothetical protein